MPRREDARHRTALSAIHVPGVRLRASDQPALFAVLDALIAQTRQPAPTEVHLVAETNARVFEAPRWFGLGRRRVLLLGYGLLNLVTVEEFRAVLAHELCHFGEGDARHPTVKTDPAASRAHELRADAFAVSQVGAEPVAAVLERLERFEDAFESFVEAELEPLLAAGLLPPIAEGFDAFGLAWAARRRPEASAGVPDAEDPYPSILERLAAVRAHPSPGPRVVQTERARTLLSGVPDLERGLASVVTTRRLEPISWAEATRRPRPEWREARSQVTEVLGPIALPSLPGEPAAVQALGRRMFPERTQAVPIEWLSLALGAAICDQLAEAGVAIERAVGEPARFVRGEHRLTPIRELEAHFAGRATEPGWAQQCAAFGLETLTSRAAEASQVGG